MIKLISQIRALYHLLMPVKKQESILWGYLKQYHTQEKFHSGIFEQQKRIELVFTLAEGVDARFVHRVFSGKMQYWGRALESFDPDLTTDMFVLATHFNNLLRAGKVIVDPDGYYVDYSLEADYATNLLYPGEIVNDVHIHFRTTRDVHWAFQKLNAEREEPAIIIADLMRLKEEEAKGN